MYKKNLLQKCYGWIGFVVFWSFVSFIIWSMIEQDKAIDLLVRIFS